MHRLGVAALAAAASVGVMACALLAGIEERTTSTAEAGLLDSGASIDSGAPTCNRPRWPNPPDVQPGGNAEDFNVAVRTFDLGFEVADSGDAEALAVFGYDLDCVDTCAPGPESCRVHGNAAEHCDEPNGGDNYAANLLQQVGNLLPGAPSVNDFDFNAHIASGDRGFVIQLTGYNGAPNATGFAVTVYASSGIRRARDGGVNDGAAPFAPSWDGQDDWALDPSSVADPDAGGLGGTPLFFDLNAYATNGVVVAHFAQMAIPVSLGVGTGVFIVDDATLTANIVASDAGAATLALAQGLIGARIRTGTILSGLAQFTDPYTLTPLCGSNSSYQVVKPLICGSADINASSTHDNLGYGCNALSVAIRFEAEPTATSNYVARVPETMAPGCTDAGVFRDDCDADNGDY
jgi:hypothetical protein